MLIHRDPLIRDFETNNGFEAILCRGTLIIRTSVNEDAVDS